MQSWGKLKDQAFPFRLIPRYHRGRKSVSGAHVISDKTCEDLDFEALFMFLDRTNSVVGQQVLYDILRCIPKKREDQKEAESLITKFSEDEEFRLDVQTKLRQLSKAEAYYLPDLFQDEHLEAPGWFRFLPVFSAAAILLGLLTFFYPPLILVLLVMVVVNIGIHYWNKKHLYQYSESIPHLLKLNAVAKELFRFEELRFIHPELRRSTEELHRLRSLLQIFRTEAGMDDLRAIFAWLLELLKAFLVLEPIFLFKVLKRLDDKRKDLEAVFRFVGMMDVYHSVASLRAGLEVCCQPEFSKEVELKGEALYHPLIKNCVPNDVHQQGRSMLLTGSNMSGKTSFIRTIGINVITGLTLNTCFARSFRMTNFQLHSAIRISDDLLNDKSYYFEEVQRVKEMLGQSEKADPQIFLLDEIFKGTNTTERIAAGKAVLSALAKNGNLVLVSTHDVELADMLHEQYDLYHFSESVENDEVAFDYKLKEGKVTEGNAIRILQMNDYPPEVIREALQISRGRQ